MLLQGTAEIVRDAGLIEAFLAVTNAKYDAQIGIGFLDPDVNPTVRVPPSVVIALREPDFEGSPTRWNFPRAC